jgi:hypothetical protein
MTTTRRAILVAGVWVACWTFTLPAARADEVVHVPRASTWRYFRGLSEASSPDVAAWRQPDFDDSSWTQGPAPFGFGDPMRDGPFGTDLAALEPPMLGNYTCVFLRREFELAELGEIRELRVRADYDDGFIAWVNGREVVRANMRGSTGDAVTFDGVARTGRESGAYQEIAIDEPPPQDFLVRGRNVLAVQAFNVSRSSTDYKIDVELVDPFGPDLTPPRDVLVVPGPGTTVRSLTSIEVHFDEEVAGVEARDLLVSGSPAAALAGAGPGPYVFTFPALPPGRVEVAWAADHAIHDVAPAQNAYAAGPAWHYNVDPAARPGNIVLNEILAANGGSLLDEDGEASDWVEVHNRGSEPVDLGGWSLSDDSTEPSLWVFPNVTLVPGQFLVVFTSGKDRRDPLAPHLHTNFRLDADGEFLGLYSPELPRTLVSSFSPAFPLQREDISYGVAVGALSYFETPTPGAVNDAASTFSGIAAAPVASAERGFYPAPFEVELRSATSEAAIYYTLDGSEPSPANGQVYSAPIPIAGTPRRAVVTLRAAAFRDGLLPSDVSTSTYIFREHVLTQPRDPDGFPSTWGNGTRLPGDYLMDPRVFSSQDVTDRALEGLISIPTLSVVLNVDDIFHPQRGIYSNGASEGIIWERAASAELIFADGKEGFQVDCGLRIQGGSSTDPWKSPKLSMRLLFRGDYGAKKLRFPFFGDGAVDRFDTLVLDAGLNLVMIHPSHDQRVRSQYVRDQFVADLQLESGSLAPHGRFVNLYLNGLHWGLYNVHERPDASFQAEYLGGDKSEFDTLRHTGSQVVDGDTAAWNAMLGLARATTIGEQSQYLAIQGFLDTVNLADYMLFNFFVGNDDWPHHNWYVGRRRATGAAYKFFSWDAEHVLKDVNLNNTSVSNSNSPAELFSRLRLNPEFRLLVADRVHRYFFNGGLLYVDPQNPEWSPEHPERNVPASVYLRRIREIDTAIILESARWGDHYRPAQPYTRDNEWLTELNWLLRLYFPRRSANVLNQLVGMALYPRVGAPVLSQHGGEVPAGFRIELTLPQGTEGAIYLTTDGTDPRIPVTGDVSPIATLYGAPLVIDRTTRVLARTLAAGTWSALADAVFVVPSSFAALRVSEILYHPAAGEEYEFLELQNAGGEALDLSGLKFTAGIDFTFPPGEVLGPGEHLVLAADEAAFARFYPGVPLRGVYPSSLDNGGERLTLEDAFGNTVLSFSYDDEDLWPLAPDGLGFSLVLADIEGDPGDPASWRASAEVLGSPGAADPRPRHGGVVLNEVLANPQSPLEDAVELYNPTSRDVDVGGWFLSDDRSSTEALRKFRIPAGTLVPSGGYLVFYENQLNSSPGMRTSFALQPAGGAVFLASADALGDLSGHLVGLEYGAQDADASFGRVRTSFGADLAPLAERTFGNDAPASVEEFRRGSGERNAAPAVGPVVIHEVHYHPGDGDPEFVEIHNLAAQPAALFDEAAGRGWQLRGISARGEERSYEFPRGAVVPPQGFLLLVTMNPAFYRSRYSVPAVTPVHGPFGGALDNGGESLTLLRPSLRGEGQVAFVLADRVRYDDDEPWPLAADGQGPSLERIAGAGFGNEPLNWAASLVSGGTPGAPNSVSPPPGNQSPAASFTAEPVSGAAPLAVRFDASASRDPDGSLASFLWDFGDGMRASGQVVDHTFDAPGVYDVLLRVTDDAGAAATASSAVRVEIAMQGGGQLPGDTNQDGAVNLTDGVVLLNRLFRGFAGPLPCEGSDFRAGPNRAVFDVNADGGVNLSDPVFLLNYLFLGGRPPALGLECVRLADCQDVCAAR